MRTMRLALMLVALAIGAVSRFGLQDTSTELRVSEVRYDATIPDELFDPQGLPQASKHPLWTPRSP